SLPYLTRIARELGRSDDDAQAHREGEGEGAQRTPLILFGKGTGAYVEALAATGAEGVGVDWLVDIGDAARRAQGKVALQGNLDPATLYGSPEAIRKEAR